MEITNQTKRPLVIALPGGKKLRLGPGKTAQISAKAAEHPAVKKLVEAGQVGLFLGRSGSGRSSGGGGVSPSARRGSGPSQRQSGDR